MQSPCKECNLKGCGSYHDLCEKYQEFRKGTLEASKAKVNTVLLVEDGIHRMHTMKTRRNTNGIGRISKKL